MAASFFAGKSDYIKEAFLVNLSMSYKRNLNWLENIKSNAKNLKISLVFNGIRERFHHDELLVLVGESQFAHDSVERE